VSDDELFLLLEEEGVEPLDLVVEEPHEGGPLPRDSRVTGSNLTTIIMNSNTLLQVIVLAKPLRGG
jgi:hypothetical protein